MPSVLWILFDGGGDRPNGGKTPFHVAFKPTIDYLTSLRPLRPHIAGGQAGL